MTNALSAASLGTSSSTLPYQNPNPYPLLTQAHAASPYMNMAGILPSASNGISNLSSAIPSSPFTNYSPPSNLTARTRSSSSAPSNYRNFAHHSSPAVDYRQPSPPGDTKEKSTKEDGFTMAPPSSRKRILEKHDENKNVCYTGMQEGKDEVSKSSTTKESPVAKRRHGDPVSMSNSPYSAPNTPTLLPTSVTNTFQDNVEVHSIPNLVSPTPNSVEAAAIYSKAWAQQMKIMQQNQSPLICNTSAVNQNQLPNQFSSLSAINRPLMNSMSQVGSFDVDAYNAALFLNQSIAATAQNNAANNAYGSSVTSPFGAQYNFYDPTSNFWF